MGEFLKQEKRRQVEWKLRTSTLSEASRADGTYPSRPGHLPYCLPASFALENLFPEIREIAVGYFARHGIKWHGSDSWLPSTHLVDSQVCCVNFLMPLWDKRELLVDLFRPYFPGIKKAIPLTSSELLVAFEWIGKKNYLKEKVRKGEARSRGQYFTSADAAVMFETEAGGRIIVLIEWKYSESYSSKACRYSDQGTDRTTIYRHLWEKETCPIDRSKVRDPEWLYYEPFYQFMRQQLLAQEMENAREIGADKVYLLHLSPASNHDFQKITSSSLIPFGGTATEVWQNVLVDPSRFIPIHVEDLFDETVITAYPEACDYWSYLKERYPSILGV